MSGRFDVVRAILGAHIAAGEITGGVVLVAQHGKIELIDAQGVCDVDPDWRLAPDTIFCVASMTKPVTAALATILVAEGRLGLDDPVSKFVPEFDGPRLVRTLKPGQTYPPFNLTPGAPPPEPDYDYTPMERPLSVHDFLSFTSGLQTISIPNAALPVTLPEDTVASYVAKLGEVPLEFQPGTRWHYSNATGYEVVARIIEVASGKGFAEFAQDRLFGPLGMTDTRFGSWPQFADRTMPLGMLAGGRSARTDYPSGSAGIFTTAPDYFRFAQMLLDGGMWKGQRIMPAPAVAMMHTNQIGAVKFPGVRAVEYASHDYPSPGCTYGYGVAIVEQPDTAGTAMPAGSFGWDGIGTRRFWVSPALDLVAIMLMPGLGAPADATHRDIERALTELAAAPTS